MSHPKKVIIIIDNKQKFRALQWYTKIKSGQWAWRFLKRSVFDWILKLCQVKVYIQRPNVTWHSVSLDVKCFYALTQDQCFNTVLYSSFSWYNSYAFNKPLCVSVFRGNHVACARNGHHHWKHSNCLETFMVTVFRTSIQLIASVREHSPPVRWSRLISSA